MMEDKPDIIGMSALLTTTAPYKEMVIDTMKETGIRDDYVCWSAACRSTRSSARDRRRDVAMGVAVDRQGL
jgi:methanogenic corrinoid protein MtbC1